MPKGRLKEVVAVAVAETHGLGKRALSNIDCFHYAYAKAAGAPILTLDRLLGATDIEIRPRTCVERLLSGRLAFVPPITARTTRSFRR